MAYWLVKEEASKYRFEQFLEDRRTCWDLVRNYQARNNLRLMKQGDRVVFYHSGKLKTAMGTAEVVREAYPDPSASEGDWSAVDLEVREAYSEPVPLAAVRADEVLRESPMFSPCRACRSGGIGPRSAA